jgi:hypothetical protein
MKNGGGMSIDRPRATILGLQKVYAHKHKARGYLKAVGGGRKRTHSHCCESLMRNAMDTI